ncbi:hypothetical protein OSB04_004709 [Centaurea solstitialis]|uniref:Pseudouridine synthase RsuA/RluA-like domain-containing protein n=1 Tax=Centaurea solstitialis TaxID=347529 RepID=A0AA38WR13_9ASTR|nr:hypothetical protein OSB04_004709 [Centaurea solstitialis]
MMMVVQMEVIWVWVNQLGKIGIIFFLLRKLDGMELNSCGQCRKNTVVGILQVEHDLAPLFPVHRLDRLVSGLLILARRASQADLFRQQIESGTVQKQYIAKVVGEFPEEEV